MQEGQPQQAGARCNHQLSAGRLDGLHVSERWCNRPTVRKLQLLRVVGPRAVLLHHEVGPVPLHAAMSQVQGLPCLHPRVFGPPVTIAVNCAHAHAHTN